ncbi:General transcription factor IIF subunit 1 [Cichlidogyrus casuarinus]|uniref:Transcription initiation factor IIF subunit alpha n=1 Tax=Cichlidogyrus casuarinus TaxID=1844966 RepID=A0ABD2Q6J2_9PLAT
MQVRVPSRKDKRFSVLRFHASDNVKLASQSTSSTEVFMQRENNLRQFKGGLPQMDQTNKTGAGSEFNKDAKQEARLRKLGHSSGIQSYRAEDQPWLMTVGKGSNSRRFRGVKEGTVSDNVQYFMFCQTKDGNFDAYPIQDWYKMSAEVSYRYLKDEEAEAEFSKLNKTKNLFNVMVKKKIEGNNDADDEDTKKGSKSNGTSKTKKNARKSFKLTDLEDIAASDMDDDLEEFENVTTEGGEDRKELTAEEKVKKRQEKMEREQKKLKAKLLARKRQNVKQRKRKQRKNRGDPFDSNEEGDSDYLNDEVEDESDPDDHLGDEVDYMTNSSSDEDNLSDEEREKLYEAPGVDEEAGLKALLTDISSSEDEDEAKKQKTETAKTEEEEEASGVEESGDRKRKAQSGKKKRSSSSESAGASSGGSDSGDESSTSEDSSGDSNELDEEDFDAKNTKKLELLQQLSRNVMKSSEATSSEDSKRPEPAKKSRTDESSQHQTPESDLMQAVKKYLHRKPITVTDLLRKIKSKKLVPSNVNVQVALANVLKQVVPVKTIINGQPVLYLK